MPRTLNGLAELRGVAGVERAVLNAQDSRRFAACSGWPRTAAGRSAVFSSLLTTAPIAGKLQRGQRPVAGVHVLGAQLVGGQRVAHAAQDGELVGHLGQLGQVLADLHARHVGVDRLELAAEFAGGVGLQVEGVHVRRAAAQADINRRLALAGGPRRLRPSADSRPGSSPCR